METAESLPTNYVVDQRRDNIAFLTGVIGFTLVGMVLALPFLMKNFSFVIGNPTPSKIDTNNITDNSFTVTWETKDPTSGYIIYGSSPENLLFEAYDNEAPEKSLHNFKTKTHIVTLTGLEPGTYYYYSIVSGGKNFDEVDGKFFEPVTTSLVSPFAGSIK